MKDPRDYLEDVRRNLKKLQAQRSVTPAVEGAGWVATPSGLTTPPP